MKKTYQAQHNEHITRLPFEEVIQAFERAVGSVECIYPDLVAKSKDTAEFERLIREHEGPSSFMRFFTADHGAWAGLEGMDFRARLYIIGNPLIAITMLKHEVAAQRIRRDRIQRLAGSIDHRIGKPRLFDRAGD